ncbi:MAG: hypothetical protein QOG67_3724 [Verrucomicrobiota bacterium]|jgi:hypothetical protein
MASPYLITLALGSLLTLVFAALVCFHRRRRYATWAKVTSIVTCVAGLGWGALGFMIAHWKSYHLTRDAYYKLVGIKGILGGIAIGFAISILVARPYRTVGTETPPA